MRYRVGPLRVRAEAWPEAWLAHAARYLDVDDAGDGDGHDDGGRVTVSFAGAGLTGDDARDGRAPGELVRARRDERATQLWHLAGGGSFVGTLDEHERRLVVRARSHDEDPWLALGNALRALVATTLPTQLDGLMIHACAGVVGARVPAAAASPDAEPQEERSAAAGPEGSGVLVAGVSTAGKTTLARGFRSTTYVTDDVSLVVDASTAPRLVPSPFFGEAGGATRGAAMAAPLHAIGILVGKVMEAGAHSTYERVAPARAAFELLRHVARFTDDDALSRRLFDVAVSLVERVPVVLVKRSLADASDDVIARILTEARC